MPHTDFGGALPHRGREHAVESYACQHSCDEGKDTDQNQREASGRLRVGDQDIDRLHLRDQEARVSLLHGGANRTSVICRIIGGANRPGIDGSGALRMRP